jgi:AcrR family transcriptional regulator
VSEPAQQAGGTRRERLRAELSEQIKHHARLQLRADGPSGISLRAIARRLGMSAPALHYYFPTLSDLVSALREDVLREFGDLLEATRQRTLEEPLSDRLFALLRAYRGWALENPQEFGLIWGLPVRGCAKPDLGPTKLFARRGTALLTEIAREALGSTDAALLMQRAFEQWIALQGLVWLEANGQLEWLGDTLETFFRAAVRNGFAQLGLPPPREL